MAQNLRAYTDPLKAGEGFCLDGVVFNDKTMGYDEEKSIFRLSPPDDLDVGFQIGMDGKTGKESKTLFERLDRDITPLQGLDGNHIRVLRKQEPMLNGMKFQDWIGERVSDNITEYKVMAENRPDRPTLQRPAIHFEFTAGGDKGSPFTAEQISKIWDTVLHSLRLSPANGGQSVDPKAGTVVPTTKVGQTCPKTGIWEARLPASHPSASNLASSSSRFATVEAGQSMPEVYARFMFPQTADADNAAIVWTLRQAA